MAAPPEIIQLLDGIRDRGDRTVIVLRGLPGSGKSTLAGQIDYYCSFNGIDCEICSADRWYTHGGRYNWLREELHEAHVYCRGKALLMMWLAIQVVVIDNTNLRTRDYTEYLEMAEHFWYDFDIVEFTVDNEQEAWTVANRSRRIHNLQTYDPWGRWQNQFESENRAIRLRPRGIDPENAAQEEREDRGYYRR